MGDSFQYDVFISHSSKDKGVVRNLAQRLKRDGLRVCLEDEQGLEHSRVLALAMSTNAFASEMGDVGAAYDDVSLPARLRCGRPPMSIGGHRAQRLMCGRLPPRRPF